MKSDRANQWGILLVILGFVIAVPGFWLLVATDHYQAIARIEFNPKPDLRFYDLHLIQNRFEVMQSHSILSNVVVELRLDTGWGKRYADSRKLEVAEATDRLKRSIRLTPIRGTEFVDVGVISEDFIESGRIADAVADAYCAPWTWCLRGANIAKILERDLIAAEEDIKTAQTEVDRLKVLLNPPDALPEKPDSKWQPYFEAKEKLERLKKLGFVVSLELNSSWLPAAPFGMIHRAIRETTPIYPNRTLGLILVDGCAILAGIGLFLLVRRLRNTAIRS
jgi:capsular polysaccharide biosynthesis protein